MTARVVRISAVGTRGDACGKLFIAKPDPSGRYVLNKKAATHSSNPTNKAVNKVYVTTLDEAARLLETDAHLINVVAANGTRALRALSKVTIQRQ